MLKRHDDHRATSHVDLSALLIAALVAYLPYAELLNQFLPFQILGYSAVTTVFPTALLVVAFGSGLAQRRSSDIAVVALASFAFAIVLLRGAFELSEVSWFHGIVLVRYYILVPLFFTAVRCAGGSRWFVSWAPRIILVNGVIAALVGVFNAASLINFRLKPTSGNPADLALYLAGEQGRATGLFLGPNTYGNFLVLPLLLLNLKLAIPKWILVPARACLLLGILASQSRGAILGATFVLFSIVFEKRRSFSERLAVALISAFLLSLTWTSSWSSIAGGRVRIEETSLKENRLAKANIFISAIGRNWWTILVGANDSDLVLGQAEDQKATDNSYLLIASNLGLPAALLFFGVIGSRMRMRCQCGYSYHWRTLELVALSMLALNNAILWDFWILYLIVLHEMDYRVNFCPHLCIAKRERSVVMLRSVPIRQRSY